MSTNYPPPEDFAAAWAATQAVHRLFFALDEGLLDDAAALFAAEGVWVRQGQNLTGPSGVRAGLATRPSDLSTRHLVTNLVVEPSGDGMEARYYVLVFDHIGVTQGPAPLASPAAVFVCQDRLVQTAQGWRFDRRAPKAAFIRKQTD